MSSYEALWIKIQDNLTSHFDLEHIKQLPAIYGSWWVTLAKESPGHVFVETTLCLFIFYILFVRKTGKTSNKIKVKLSESEIDELVAEWSPEPLCPEIPDRQTRLAEKPIVIERFEGGKIKVEGIDELITNMATFDFLGFGSSVQSKEASRTALMKYGCGSCGPRGFYGSFDTHLKIEEEVAKFMKMPQAISYSDAASTLNSVIPAFSKKGDFIIADESVHESIKTGLLLSRSKVQYFKHNDMEDLARILEEKSKLDKKNGCKPADQRRFIVVEGLYRNHGDICPLKQLLSLKEKYYYRLILDESFSFGVLGATGRGITEHFQVQPSAVEAIVISMETSLASVGGLCVGNVDIIDHQRLSGAGYCFSAAAPPFMSVAASASLRNLDQNPSLIAKLQENAKHFHELVSSYPQIQILSEKCSPIHYISYSEHLPEEVELGLLDQVNQNCLKQGFALVVTKSQFGHQENRPPSLRVVTHSMHSCEELRNAAKVICSEMQNVLQKVSNGEIP